ncbi:MAG: acyl-CoA dehydrogenase family protein [candidate division KSB1 bacterium]|nr:acyl-CoA dehydrogenase family protein [candidate division KSB1 bacterium]MDZ7301523.1 acyl-CoA dehydrogenase family protein [candidate division KSB1 bacterium]MDZ7311061.1 acyl-CoA dehydrogenase family protein [candidate division KSB1 bacterium]
MISGGEFLITPIIHGEIMTREKFSEEQKEIARVVEEFAVERILKNKQAIEKYDKELSLTLFRECGGMGLLSTDLPAKYGGSALGTVTAMRVAEGISFGESASFSVTFSAHSGIATLPILFFGNGQQKSKYLPKIGSGEWMSAYALTEAEAGSDALSQKTTATLTPDGKFYIVNGIKQFISNGAWADVYIVFADAGARKMAAFIVERTWEGVSPGPEEHKMGIKGSSTTSVTFDNVKVPVENLLGEIGQGHQVALDVLDLGRLKLGAADLGGCRAVIKEAVAYALQRRQFGRPIAQFDAIKSKFADMVIRTFALDSIVYRTAAMYDEILEHFDLESETPPPGIGETLEKLAIEASINKVHGTESLWIVADHGLQILGGYGFLEDYPMAAAARDNRVDRIFEGTNEINRQIIAGFALRKALMEELPLRENTKPFSDGRLRVNTEEVVKLIPDSEALAAEKRLVEMARQLALFVFNEAAIAYGQDLRNEQQIGEALADIFIDLYVIDSALRRVAQNPRRDRTWNAIVKVLIAESAARMLALARKIITALPDAAIRSQQLQDLLDFAKVMLPATNTIALKREIAEDLYEVGKYRF